MGFANDFSYILRKIEGAEFATDPFPHLLIEDFFSQEHFSKIINSKQIKLKKMHRSADLLGELRELGYKSIDFPGSITSERKYLDYIEKGIFKRSNISGYGREVIGGYGITYRLHDYQDEFLGALMSFFESDSLVNLLREKFDITKKTIYEGGIQKNLKGYEISPHPDTSRKALTWMANIYTDDEPIDKKEMHTHFCQFKSEYLYVKTFWEYNNVDPVWVPWEWVECVKKTSTNNSIVFFKPGFDTLHAVRVSEDHLVNQRNQIYGNLWYEESQKKGSASWKKIDLLRKQTRLAKFFYRLGLI